MCSAKELVRLYSFLDLFDAAGLAETSKRCSALLVALEEASTPPAWRVKPKMQLMIELCEYVAPQAGNPRDFWTYRDEDVGGTSAKVTARRGGKFSATKVSEQFLVRHMAMHRMQL